MALPLEFRFPSSTQNFYGTLESVRNFRQIELLFDKFIRNYTESKVYQPTQKTVAADTAEHDMHTTAIASGEMRGNGMVHVTAVGTATGAGGTKSVRLYFGGSVVFTATIPTGTSTWWIDALIFNRNSETSQGIMAKVVVNSANPAVGFGTASVDTTATAGASSTAGAIAIKTTGQKVSGADVLTEELLHLTLIPSLT